MHWKSSRLAQPPRVPPAAAGSAMISLRARAVRPPPPKPAHLPRLLLEWTGFSTDGLFTRILGDEQGCNSRRLMAQGLGFGFAGHGFGLIPLALGQHFGRRFGRCLPVFGHNVAVLFGKVDQ